VLQVVGFSFVLNWFLVDLESNHVAVGGLQCPLSPEHEESSRQFFRRQCDWHVEAPIGDGVEVLCGS
jgi:hypothetical protein